MIIMITPSLQAKPMATHFPYPVILSIKTWPPRAPSQLCSGRIPPNRRIQELSGGGSSGTAQVVERCQRLVSELTDDVGCSLLRMRLVFFPLESPAKMNIKNGQILKKGHVSKTIGFFPRKQVMFHFLIIYVVSYLWRCRIIAGFFSHELVGVPRSVPRSK